MAFFHQFLVKIRKNGQYLCKIHKRTERWAINKLDVNVKLPLPFQYQKRKYHVSADAFGMYRPKDPIDAN
jgi:hypothetical protein